MATESPPITFGYEPREAFVGYHTRTQRNSVLVCHRRAGKTVACILDLLDAAIHCKKKNPRFAYVAPLLKQSKDTAWTYLKEYGLKIPGATVHENELRLDLPGGKRVRLYGGDNPDSMRGIYLDGVVLDEYGDMHPKLYAEVIGPALLDREGWVTRIGTPKGPNSFYDLWQEAQGDPDFFTMMLRASQSGILSESLLADQRRHMSPEQFAREFECSFAAPDVGVFYGKEMETALNEERILPKVFSPTHEVYTAWDLGRSDMTVIWFFQKVGMQIRLVDYYSASLRGLDHYAKIIKDRDYNYGEHVLPHDLEQEHLGVSTIAHSRKTALIDLGVKPIRVMPKDNIMDGVNAVRKMLPRCVFDKDKCAEGIKALQLYHREWDDMRKVFLEKPYHDWTSHPADAFRYLALSLVDRPASNSGTSWLKKTKDRLGWIV